MSDIHDTSQARGRRARGRRALSVPGGHGEHRLERFVSIPQRAPRVSNVGECRCRLEAFGPRGAWGSGVPYGEVLGFRNRADGDRWDVFLPGLPRGGSPTGVAGVDDAKELEVVRILGVPELCTRPRRASRSIHSNLVQFRAESTCHAGRPDQGRQPQARGRGARRRAGRGPRVQRCAQVHGRVRGLAPDVREPRAVPGVR